MKKAIALVMAACLALSLVACGGGTTSTASSAASGSTSTAASSEAASSEAATSEAAPATEAGVKTGMAIVSNTTVADADADGDGNAQVDSTAAAVLVGEDGKIISCKLDVAQNKVPVKADGSFDTTATFQSKQELKEGYNMKGASPIGKEWYEQANAFAEYVVGMTADEVRAIEVGGDHNGPTDADIAASCTMNVTDMIEAIAQATENAQVLGANADDTLGLGLSTEFSSSAVLPADNEGEGLVQTDTTYAAVTYDAEGKITSSIWDCTQAKFNTTEEGVVTAASETIVPKQTQKESYGMKGISPIGKEWYEQAQAYADWLVGKTADEVAGIETDAEAHNGPTDADIAASCTMDVREFNTAVTKALG